MAERPTPEAVFKRWLGGVGGVKPTVFYGAPTGFAGMLASNLLPKREDVALRLVSSAGEALPAEIGERFKRHFGVDIVDGIGSTEMLHIFISNRPDKVRYGTTGWPVPGYEIELRGEDGRAVQDGEPGDLYIRGPSAALMYWGNRAKTRETFEGRWTRSGDKYIRNADGTFTYAGRSDDMLKVGGVWVSPFEVEATLVQHPSVLEAAVIGAPDADGLIKTKAFVVLKEGASADEAELQRFVKDRLAPYKYPRSIAFIAELPKTATGKIQRFRLREQERETEAAETGCDVSLSALRIEDDKPVAGPGLGVRRLVGGDEGHAEFEPLADRLARRQISLDAAQRRAVVFARRLRRRSDPGGLPGQDAGLIVRAVQGEHPLAQRLLGILNLDLAGSGHARHCRTP